MTSSSSMLSEVAVFPSFYDWIIFHCVCVCINIKTKNLPIKKCPAPDGFIIWFIHFSILFIHLSTDGYLVRFHVFTVINKTAVNMGLKIPLQDSDFIFSDTYLEVQLPDHTIVLVLTFWGASIMVSIVDVPIYIPSNSTQAFPFLYIFASSYYLLSF